MVAETPWRELCRIEDPVLARAVATSIAAMEFDVRLAAAGGMEGVADDETGSGRPPYVVEVDRAEWQELADVLDEIIQEQRDFDRLLAERCHVGRHARLVTVITLAGAADVLLLLGLIDW